IADLEHRLAEVKQQQEKAGKDAEDKLRAAAKQPQPKETKPQEKAADGKAASAKAKDAKQPEPAATAKADAAKADATAKKLEQDLAKGRNDARRPFEGKLTQLNQALDELNGRVAIIDGRHDDGLKLLERANG